MNEDQLTSSPRRLPYNAVMSIDVPEDAPRPAREQDSAGFTLDAGRLFYHSEGAFKHDWHYYDVDQVSFAVRVYWTRHDYVALHDEDAQKFLSITKSRFARAAEERLRDNPLRTGMRSAPRSA
jgi:hypothetical protein